MTQAVEAKSKFWFIGVFVEPPAGAVLCSRPSERVAGGVAGVTAGGVGGRPSSDVSSADGALVRRGGGLLVLDEALLVEAVAAAKKFDGFVVGV